MTDKKLQRKFYKQVRSSVTDAEKEIFDSRIISALINCNFFKKSSLILTYVSFGSEISTVQFIEYALKNGKRVAVPKCVDGRMFFHEISSLNDLVCGKYGIPGVKDDSTDIISDFDSAICIVPGLSFDRNGNRIGYGGGYYDRFLCDKNLLSVGLTYERCISKTITTDEYDIPVDYVITESSLIKGGFTNE